MMKYTNIEVLDKLLAFFIYFFCIVEIHDVQADKVSYGYKMEGVMFRKLLHLSLEQCHKECTSRKTCKSYNYMQSVHLCELNNVDKDNVSANYVKFAKAVYGQKKDLEAPTVSLECSSCEDHKVCERLEDGTPGCFIRECQNSPPVYDGAKALGNLNHVGAKVRYICASDAVRLGNPVSQCTGTGNWSLPDFKCIPGKCWTPTNDSKYHIINVTTYLHSAVMHFRCNGDFITRGSPIRCNDNGNYRYEYACCDSPDQNPWVRIFRINGESNVGTVALWNSNPTSYPKFGLDGNTVKDCQFRRWDIISNWSTLDILKVKVEIIVNSSVSSRIIFNGKGSTNMDWFSADRIDSTSWHDLSTGTETPLISIIGRTRDDVQARFAIMNNHSFDDCDIISGWLMITAGHQCFTRPRGIQFANGPSKATNATEFQSADSLEVFVEFAN